MVRILLNRTKLKIRPRRDIKRKIAREYCYLSGMKAIKRYYIEWFKGQCINMAEKTMLSGKLLESCLQLGDPRQCSS